MHFCFKATAYSGNGAVNGLRQCGDDFFFEQGLCGGECFCIVNNLQHGGIPLIQQFQNPFRRAANTHRVIATGNRAVE